jgi:hypothetical protein
MDRLPQGWVVVSITQVTPRPSIPNSDPGAVAKLFSEDRGEHCTRSPSFLLSNGKHDEQHQERNSEAVVEAGLNIERLANSQWHSVAAHDHLAEAGIGWGEDGCQNARFPPRQSAQHDNRAYGA